MSNTDSRSVAQDEMRQAPKGATLEQKKRFLGWINDLIAEPDEEDSKLTQPTGNTGSEDEQ